MRRVFWLSVLVASSAITASSAFAITCTDRQQVCFAYCEKNYNNAPNCRATCGILLSKCMSTGCWESKVTAKRCGISRQ
jgi:hypothetical protein